MKWRVLIKGLAMLAVLVAVGFLLKSTSLGTFFEREGIDQLVKGKGLTGEVIFVAAGALFTAVGFSRQAVAFMGGYAFGLAHGTGLSVLAAAVGCAITFSYARFFGRESIQRRFSEKIGRVDAFLSENPFTMTLLIRFLPVGSNFLTNLAAGVSGVSAIAFISGSAVGYIPQMLIFALVGSGIHLDTGYGIGLSVILFVVSGLLGVHLYRKHRHGKRLGDDVDRELGNGNGA
ncbi:MAG: VTT domain-containing protein [Magnetovibrio sp.]|nr:VTT domain-containing protein [Magnetovibrio sp.]